MAYIIATRGRAEQCFILWARVQPALFRNEALIREAMGCELVNTIEDLALFLDGTRWLAHLDHNRIRALLEINRWMYPSALRPCIYWEADGNYFSLEFQPDNGEVFYGYLPYSADIQEQDVPEASSWVYISIKSML